MPLQPEPYTYPRVVLTDDEKDIVSKMDAKLEELRNVAQDVLSHQPDESPLFKAFARLQESATDPDIDFATEKENVCKSLLSLYEQVSKFDLPADLRSIKESRERLFNEAKALQDKLKESLRNRLSGKTVIYVHGRTKLDFINIEHINLLVDTTFSGIRIIGSAVTTWDNIISIMESSEYNVSISSQILYDTDHTKYPEAVYIIPPDKAREELDNAIDPLLSIVAKHRIQEGTTPASTPQLPGSTAQ